MTRGDVTTRPHPPRPAHMPAHVWRWILLVLGVAILAVAVPRLVSNPVHRDRVTIVNDSDYALNVEVAGADRSQWLGLGTVAKRSSAAFTEVTDPGRTWVFHFGAQGQDAGEAEIARQDLVAAGWTFRVPPDVAARLQAAGAPPTP